MFEDRYPGDGEELCQILCGQGVAGLLDLICDRHISIQIALLVLPSGPAWTEVVTADLRLLTLETE